MSRLTDYTPSALKNNDEMTAIYKVQEELLAEFQKCLKQEFENLFLETADENGITNYENILGLLHAGTLEARKNAVLVKQAFKPPYTEKRLRDFCNSLLGEGEYSLTVYEDLYAVIFQSYNSDTTDITSFYDNLRYIIPANMTLIRFVQYVYQWLGDVMTYKELTENEKYTYAELSRYWKTFKEDSTSNSKVLQAVVKYSYYYLKHNMTYRELTENEKYTYTELSRKNFVVWQYAYLFINYTYASMADNSYWELSRKNI